MISELFWHAMRDLPLRGINFESLWVQESNYGDDPKGHRHNWHAMRDSNPRPSGP